MPSTKKYNTNIDERVARDRELTEAAKQRDYLIEQAGVPVTAFAEAWKHIHTYK